MQIPRQREREERGGGRPLIFCVLTRSARRNPAN